jgi:undecaprenyl phosphate-alpha-L-ara4N flippase subunit ArnF
MTSVLFGFGFSLFTALVVIFGDYFIKIAADSGGSFASSRLLLLGCLLYAGSALLWYVSLQHIGLAQAGVAFSMFTLIALALLGALLFDEPLYGREIAGIGCALIAMVLMVRIG